MQLIVILLATVGLLTLLSGIITFFGSSKGDRIKSAWYLGTTIFISAWIASMSFFISAGPGDADPAYAHVGIALASAILLDAAFLGYSIWDRPHGQPVTLFFVVFALAICIGIFIDPHALYSDVVVSPTGNQLVFNIGPLFFAYNAFFGLIVPVTIFAFYRGFRRARSKRTRISNALLMGSFALASTVVLITDLVMPIFGHSEASWAGPLATAIVILMIYYVTLRYRAITLSYTWLRILSYVVIVASIAVVYMIIFSIVFAALFRGSTPSIEVIVLNFIMILVFIALIPAMNGLTKFIGKFILEQHPKHSEHTKAKKEPHKS